MSEAIKPCESCGRCPTCGRGAQAQPYLPYMPVYPAPSGPTWTYPYWQPPWVVTSGTGTFTTTGINDGTVIS